MGVETVIKRDLTKLPKPARVQDIIPVDELLETGVAKLKGGRYSATYRIKDIEFANSSNEDKLSVFNCWKELLNSLEGSRSVWKETIVNRQINRKDMLAQTVIPADIGDGYDYLRLAYNRLRQADVQGGGYIQDKYVTVSVYKHKAEKAESYFARVGRDAHNKLLTVGSGLTRLSPEQRMEIIYNFFCAGKENLYNYRWSKENSKKDFKTYVCPDCVRFYPGYFDINAGQMYGKALQVRLMDGSIKDDFLKNVTELKTNMVLSVDIIPLTNSEARKLIENKDDDVEGNAYQWSDRKSVKEGSAMRMPRQISKDRKIIDAHIKDMDEDELKYFLCQIIIVVLAETKDMLDDYTESIEETASEYGAQTSTLYYQQLKGLQDALPFGVRTINNLRDCNSDTTAIMLPFNDVAVNHNSGIPYGRHEGTMQQQFVDRRLLVNGHEWVLGVSGSGKSMNVKLKMVFEAMLTDGDIVICDPDGEYTPIVRALGGQVVVVGEDNINIADITPDYDDKDPVKAKIELILSFIDAIIDETTTFGETEKSLVDRALRSLYQAVMEGKTQYITLTDMYDLMLSYDIPAATNLMHALERHIIGSFGCFAKPTNVNVDSRIVCYNLQKLGEQHKNAGMLVVLDNIEQRLIRNRHFGRATYIKLDEMDYYFRHESSCRIIENFFERSRKYGGFITAIVQNISKVLQIPAARTMISNSANTIMMRQDMLDARDLASMYGLSQIQVKTLINAAPGHGINKIGDILYSFDGTIPEDNELYPLINTTVVKN